MDFLDVVTVGDDDLIGAGRHPETGALVIRTDDRCNTLWSVSIGKPGDLARGLAAFPGGDILVDMSLGGKAYVSRLLPGGGQKWQVQLLKGGPGTVATLAALQDNGLVVAGYAGLPGNGAVFASRLDGSGNVLWDWQGKSWYIAGAQGIAITTAGIALAGHTQTGKGPKTMNGWLGGLDLDGQLIWERTIGGEQRDAFYGLAAIDGGGLFAAGHTMSKGAGGLDGWLVRTDAWGQLPCAISGACAKADFNACDDGDGCTLDVCLPLGGCKHDPVQCGGGKLCKAGACGL